MTGTVHLPGWCVPEPLLANSGGPCSRTRTERVASTLVGRDAGHVRCPKVYRLGLRFDATIEPPDPVEYMLRYIRRLGIPSPEALRAEIQVPTARLIALPAGSHASVDVRHAPEREVLEQALMLGLCTRHLCDPARPVHWTTASLGRCLELFDPAGFYA